MIKFIFIFLAFLIILLIATAFVFFRIAIVRSKSNPSGTSAGADMNALWKLYSERIVEGRKWFSSMSPEPVSIISHDGLRLSGRYLPSEGSRRTLLLMHGYRSSADNDFPAMFKFYHDAGFNLLVIDQRSHGKSEGNYICYGVKERFDCLSWIEYLNSRFDGIDIFLHGISMGASTVLMASGLELPENVRGIIADAGFTSPWDEFKHVLKTTYHLPAFPVLYVFGWVCRCIAGFGIREVSTLETLKSNKIPVLFIHGLNDNFVPTYMSRLNHDACLAPKQLLLIEGAKHAVSFLADTRRCGDEMLAFLEKYSTVSVR